ncbi:MAG TPA: c-type cytochrome [Crocinitomicaceae bacterium]|nr:c-type cytochrome [Crocinitomicaceae bacterium]
MNFKGQLFLLLFSFFALSANAQDGESLFKAKCAACHMLGKDGTGPNLKGVKQKWENAGEGELIYKWVANSQELVASGNSQLALKADEYSAISMPPQQVSNEEIDAILGFVNDFAPPPPPPTEETTVATTGEKEVKYVPNYKKNLKLFYWLIIALAAQIIAILSVSGSLKTMIKLDKDKKSKSNTNVILALVGMFGFMSLSNKTLALEFMQPGLAKEGAPWLLVENSDLVVLVILNIVMLFVFLHFRKLFMDITKTIRPQTEKQKQKQLSKRQERKLNKILVGAVDIEEEHTILMHHEYDGIKELDNNLPPWWVWMFWVTIVFAVVYVFNYHILGTADLQIAEYEKDMKQSEELVQAYLKEQGMQVDASNVTLMEDEAELATGKTIFEANCVLCHNPNGEGNIGPNLTDNAWIYGYDIATVFTTVKDGTTKGMPEHASKLNPIQLQQVASFILTMPEAKGKSPEGSIIEK